MTTQAVAADTAKDGTAALNDGRTGGANADADAAGGTGIAGSGASELRRQGNEAFKEGRFQEALALYEQASGLLPEDAALWLNRSIAERQLERWSDAEQHAQRAVELDPANVKAFYSRALCQQHLGQLQQALLSCRAGLKVQSDNAALQQLHDLVKRQWGEQLQAAKDIGKEQCPATKLAGGKEMDKLKAKAKASGYEWAGRNPSQQERQVLVMMFTSEFRKKYGELKAQREESLTKNSGSSLQVDQYYAKEQKLGLKIQGGHRPLPRPEHVDLPQAYKKPIGIISLAKLKTFGSNNPDSRHLMSVYGHIFDVSDRPDKYGPEGPYTYLTGADITWGLFAGVDDENHINRFYDLFKGKDMGTDKLAGVCSWLGWYWTEYGDPVGHLDLYQKEADLPPPPLEDVVDNCSVM